MTQRAYTYEELSDLKPQILDVCQRVADDNPTAWRQAHNGNFDDTSTRYNDLCVQALRAVGIYAGCNGKRGGEQRSDDILAFGLSDSRGAQDRSGRFTSMAIIDYIAGAGGPSPSIGWGDVSQSAPGRFLDPQGLARVDGGGSTPVQPVPTPVPPVTTPVPPVDLGPVLAVLARVEARLAAIESRPVAGVDLSAMTDYIGAMVGAGPGDGKPNHVTDIKERIDALQGVAEQMLRILRAARVLRY